MKLKLCDIFDNSHQTAYTDHLRIYIWRNMCDYVYDVANHNVTTKAHLNVFMKTFNINGNKDLISDEISDIIYNTF